MLCEPQQTVSNFKAGFFCFGLVFFGKARGLKWREKTEMISELMLVARSA